MRNIKEIEEDLKATNQLISDLLKEKETTNQFNNLKKQLKILYQNKKISDDDVLNLIEDIRDFDPFLLQE